MDLVFLDCETTGLKPYFHEVTEVWACRCKRDTLEVVRETGGLVRVEFIERAEPEALRIGHYDPSRWALHAKPWREVWRAVQPVCAGAQVVGSNPLFDIRFINSTCARYGVGCDLLMSSAIDTRELGRALFEEEVGYESARGAPLSWLVDHFGVDCSSLGEAHSARGDVLRTIEVYRRLRQPGHLVVNPGPDAAKDPEDDVPTEPDFELGGW